MEEAELIIGSTPHLAAFPELAAEKMPYPSPMSGLPALLQAHAGRRIAVLASGDPLFYGISQNLLRFLPPEHLVFHANISSLQAAFARLGRPWQAAQLLSLHGRPLAGLRAVLQANRLYALLTDRDNSPIAIARIVAEAGFGKSDLWVSEELGTAEERFRHFQTAELADADIEFSPLNVVILETRGPGGVLPEFPGIADERFSTGEEPGKGLLSKREVRLTILSLLAPRAGEIGWDVGAGCGGVSVEWARWNPLGAVYAVECHPERLAHLGINRYDWCDRQFANHSRHSSGGAGGIARSAGGIHRRQQRQFTRTAGDGLGQASTGRAVGRQRDYRGQPGRIAPVRQRSGSLLD